MEIGSSSGVDITATGFEPFSELQDRSQLSHEEFLRLLLVQISTQNPLEPMDDEKMLNQMLSLQQMNNNQRLVQTMETFSVQFELMRFQTEFVSAAGMIGKSVKGETALGEEVEGEVLRISVEGNQVVCWVDAGQEDPVPIPFNNIFEVQGVPKDGEEGGGDT